ncbi:MAG: hypothetical protein H0V17_33420 [Deltaproteobacteria bacterium]|nr:hypothetical protein [Deltaproteobacteria bacterium]
MRRWILVALAVACSGKKTEQPASAGPDGGAGGFVHPPIDSKIVDVAPADWVACKAALEAAPKTPAMRRVQSLLGACKPCGDWKPLLEWTKEQPDGGPTRTQIEDAMIACKAYCNGDAKQRFLGTLDKFRGKETRGPWRFLGDICKEAVSAVPDNRYASAPWFALDRIARAAGERADLLPLLDAVEFPLPVISISGYGYELAKSPVTAPDAGPLAMTVTQLEMRIAVVPRGKLSKDGVVTLTRGELYPGIAFKTPAELEAAITKLGEGAGAALTGPVIEQGTGIAIFAPHAMTAQRLLDALAATGERPRIVKSGKSPPGTPATPGSAPKAAWLTGDVRLAVAATGGPPGWALAGSIPVALRTTPVSGAITLDLDDNPDPVIEQLKAKKAELAAVIAKHASASADDVPDSPPWPLWKPALAIRLGPKSTVGGLAKVVGAAVYFDVKSVALIAGVKNVTKGAK